MNVAAALTKISGTLVAGGDVNPGYRFSPDGSRIVFTADRDTDESDGIYGVAQGGGAIIGRPTGKSNAEALQSAWSSPYRWYLASLFPVAITVVLYALEADGVESSRL